MIFGLSQESEEAMFQKRKTDEMKYHPIYLIIIFARKLFMTSERKTGQKVILSCEEQFMSCCWANK